MTISTTAAIVTLQGNGLTTSFAYNFLIPYRSDGVTPAVTVKYTDTSGNITTLVRATDYTISGVGNPSGGSVTYNPGSAIPTGSYLTIERAVPYTQQTSVPNQAFYPNTVEQTADNIIEQLQQLLALQSFTISMPEVDAVAPNKLPVAALRANKFLAFDSNGQPIMSSGTGGAAPIMARTVAATTTTLTGSDYGTYVQGDARVGAISIIVPRSLGTPTNNFIVDIERYILDTSATPNVISILDDTSALIAQIISPIGLALVPGFRVRSDGNHVTARGIG